MTATRQSPPQPLAPVSFHLPEPFETKLDNGLRIVIFEDKRLPLVSFRLAFFSGDADDPAEVSGLTSAMASLLNEGTLNRTSKQLAEEVERLGANLSAHASDDFTIVAASSLSLYSSAILELMAEVTLRPVFPENELDLYKRNTIENLKFQRSQPNFLANEQASRLLFGEHPYSRVAPRPEHVERFTREALLALHAKVMAPNNAVFVVVGDVERDAFLGEVNDLFGGWKAGDYKAPEFPDFPKRAGRTLTIVDRPGSAQTNIVIGNLGIARSDPDYFPVIVMNQVLGAGASSRVFMNLREEKGYTYGAYTRFDTRRLGGSFEATAEVRTAVTGDSLKELFYELERIRSERVSDEELRDAKNFLTGVFPIRAETQEGLTNLIVNQQLYDLPADYLQTYREHIEKVSADDVLAAAQKYVRPAEAAIVLVGDAAEILPQAASYSEAVEIFDTDGRPRELSNYVGSDRSPAADVAGEWKLEIDFQGQSIPVALKLESDGDRLHGSISTMLGDGRIEEAKVRGNRLSATAIAEFQGQPLELAISASVDGETMKGTITAPISPEPLSFSGSR
ncbi:MAG: M16 family metallopeptidase [Pyrinomonadaceae bacterium]